MSVRDVVKEVNLVFYERYLKLEDSDEFWEFLIRLFRQSIRVNILKVFLEVIVERFKEEFEFELIFWVCEGFFINVDNFVRVLEYGFGLVFGQEVSLMIFLVVFDLKLGEFVLDMVVVLGLKIGQIV